MLEVDEELGVFSRLSEISTEVGILGGFSFS